MWRARNTSECDADKWRGRRSAMAVVCATRRCWIDRLSQAHPCRHQFDDSTMRLLSQESPDPTNNKIFYSMKLCRLFVQYWLQSQVTNSLCLRLSAFRCFNLIHWHWTETWGADCPLSLFPSLVWLENKMLFVRFPSAIDMKSVRESKNPQLMCLH